MKGNLWLKNEDGSVLVVALVILVLLTLLGIAITTTTEVEIQIAGNERLYKENLYNAEAAAMECAQTMEEMDSLDPSVYPWIKPKDTTTVDNIRDDSYWPGNSKVSAIDPNTRFMVVEEGVKEGTSLDMTKSTLHSYAIYGRRHNAAKPNLGRSIVKVGYLKVN